MGNKPKNDNNNHDGSKEISFFDVKQLYDAAFAEKSKTRMNIRVFSALMAKAMQMDDAYRAQLGLTMQARYAQQHKKAA